MFSHPLFQRAPEDWASRLLWLLGRLALIALVLYLIWRVQHVIALLLISGAVAYVLCPVVDWLSRWQPPRVTYPFWRGLMTLFTLIGFIGLLIWGTKMFLTPFVQETRKFVQNFDQHQQRAELFLQDIEENYQEWYRSMPESTQRWLAQQQKALQGTTAGVWNNLQTWVQGLGKQTGVWISFIVELLLMPVIVFYLVFDSRSLKREILALVPRRHLRLTLKIVQETNSVMRSYIIGQLILCVIAGITMWIGLRLFEIPYALTLALFAGAARAIPVVGPAVASLPIVLMVLVASDFTTALQVLLFITTLFLVEHKLVMPKIIGDRVALHPVLVIVVLLISGKFFGLVGMFFGVPIAAIVRNVIRWLSTPRQAVRLPTPVMVSESVSATGTEGRS